MKYLYLFFSLAFLYSCRSSSAVNFQRDIAKFQQELNSEYQNADTTPLRGSNFAKFSVHPFFPTDLKYRVKAEFVKTEDAVPFDLPTSSGKTKRYLEYGQATFILEGKKVKVSLFQSLDLIKQKEYEDYLFLPFRDETNGVETYGGGKYLDLRIPKSNSIIIDFNKSYHPYCAYNAIDYNCPIVPPENFLNLRVEAGVKYENIYF